MIHLLTSIALAGPAVDAWLERLDDRACAEQLMLTYAPVHTSSAVSQGGLLLIPPAVGDAGAREHRRRIAALQARATVPLLVATDMEGGRFHPFREHAVLAHIPSARQMGTLSDDEVARLGHRTARALRGMGVHVNLAPVLDVSDSDGHIGRFWRAYSERPEVVLSKGRAFARGLTEGGVIAVGKHYPGYGGTQGNSDHARVEATGPMHDLVFHAMAPDVPAIMMPPLVYDGTPAVLSPELVDRAHAQGWVVWTDDLYAASAYLGPTVASDAFLAGNDVLVINAPSDWGKVPAMREDLVQVATRPENRQRLRQACARVLKLKEQAGLL